MDFLRVCLISVLIILVARLVRKRSRFPLPPGPKGLPLVGLLFCRPSRKIYETYREWAATYGDLVHYQILGQSVILVNSEKAVTELLERRSSNYSDRPSQRMLFNLMKQDWNVVIMPYSDHWRFHRRMFHQSFNASQVSNYHPIQLDASVQLLSLMLKSPDDFFSHVRHHSGSIILRITYGYNAQPKQDPYVVLVDEMLRRTSDAAIPGNYLVDYVPFLERVPSWFPFTSYMKEAEAMRPTIRKIRDVPFRMAVKQIDEGTAPVSFVSQRLDKLKEHPFRNQEEKNYHVDALMNTAAITFTAGADTTVAAILTAILAMVLKPDIQAKAHAEIDTVVGRHRLPTFDDQHELPLINAIILEALRWRPVVPINVAHAAISEDIYNGYFIPAGTVMIANSLALLHDQEMYQNPQIFNPHRFLGPEPEVDPTLRGVFGFGRRVCPGRYLAMNSLFIGVAYILWAFNLGKAVDEDGQEIIPDDSAYMDAFLWHPLPFKCKITPRFPEVPGLVDAEITH